MINQPGATEYLKMGFIALQLKGYHNKYNKEHNYKIAKEPVNKGFTKTNFKSLSAIQIEQAEKEGFWIGWLVPEGYIVVDSEMPFVIELLDNIVRNMKSSIQKTNRGKQYLFRCNDKTIPAVSEYLCTMGIPLTPRVACKNYVILPPINNRIWEQWIKAENLPCLPEILLPADPNNKIHVSRCLSWHIGEAYQNNQLAGYEDLDCSFMALLIEAGLALEDIHTCFHLIFRNEYDPDRTENMYRRYKEKKSSGENVIGPGLFIKNVKDSKANEVSKWLKKLNTFLVTTIRENNDDDSDAKYFTDDEGYLCKRKAEKHKGCVIFTTFRLANFTAEILEEITEDDGNEITRKYRIGGVCQGKELLPIEIPASQFPGMGWLHHYGSRVIIEPGNTIKDTVRHAIQFLSKNTKYTNAYTHTGWRKINGNYVFLSHASAIGGRNITVQLPKETARYSLPPLVEDEHEAIRTSLSFIEIGLHDVTFPLFAAVFIAPLTSLFLGSNPINFSFYIYGETGTFKTTLAVLALCHYGNFNATALPNLEDTANSVERRAFLLKDVLMVLDDYHPSNLRKDAQAKETLIQRVIREFSNRTGRGRLNSDSTEKGRYSPRGVLLVTGEEIATLQSTIARIFVVEINKGDVNIDKLSKLQSLAHLLPHAMSSYLLWIRDNMQDIRQSFPSMFSALREKANEGAGHRKLPEQVAFLTFTLEIVSSWLMDKGIYTDAAAIDFVSEGWNIFKRLSERHGKRIKDEDAVKKFDDIILTLFRMGKVTLQHIDGR